MLTAIVEQIGQSPDGKPSFRCRCAGLTEEGPSPVQKLCRRLAASGHRGPIEFLTGRGRHLLTIMHVEEVDGGNHAPGPPRKPEEPPQGPGEG